MARKRTIKRLLIAGSALAVCTLAAINFSDLAIRRSTRSVVYNQADEVPECDAALVLGTARFLRHGVPNPYFDYRIRAAAELYGSGRVKYIVVSGDNSRDSYNEPLDMKNALVGAGVPAEAVYLDYAGFRTLDSVVRMKEIFSQERFVVVSQRFHNERAIYLARRYGLETYGYNARDVEGRFGLKTRVREKLARVKVFVDLLTGRKPRFLGEKVPVGEPAGMTGSKQITK